MRRTRERCAMRKAEIKAVVDHHVYAVNGTAHRLRLQWVATEPRFSREARYLLAIEVFSDGSGMPITTLHVMTRARLTQQELLHLVDDAVDEQMRRLRLDMGGTAPCSEVIA